MELPSNLARARLTEITWDENQDARDAKGGVTLDVQFNPESLKLSYSTQRAGNDQRGGATSQYVGEGSTKLSFDLWFDVTAPAPSEVDTRDVRRLTQQVIHFVEPQATKDKKKFLAPGLRFQWGSFSFEGTVESIGETLELFSEDGRPLRAQVSVAMTRQKILVDLKNPGKNVPGQAKKVAGTFVLQPAQQGATLQSMAAANGIEDWQGQALANGIEQPRHLPVGTGIRLE